MTLLRPLTIMIKILATLLLALISLTGCSTESSSPPAETAPTPTTEIYLPNDAKFADNAENFFDLVEVPGGHADPESLLRLLLSQKGDDHKAPLSAPFTPQSVRSASSLKPAHPLLGYLESVSVTNGIARLRFKGDSMAYLNSAISMQHVIKGAMVKTLTHHYPKIKKVEYVIDGELVTDWDA